MSIRLNDHVKKDKAASWKNTPWLVGLVLVALFSFTFYRTAWVTEDAFITFRVIDNVLNGLGPVWNPGERVQVYTHPFWFGLVLAATSLLADVYWASLLLSFLLALAALLVLLFGITDRRLPALAIVVSLLLSRAFVDYSSSGLENALVYFLMALFALLFFRAAERRELSLAVLLISALIYLSRPDAVVLCLPALGFLLFRHLNQSRRAALKPILVRGLLASVPVVLWTGFSLIYYGLPVPNTALAKVGTDLELAVRAQSAINYFEWTAGSDSLTLVMLAAGILVGLAGAARREAWSLAAGLLLWGAYLFYVGADYMGGRFFSFPLVLAAAILLKEVHQGRSYVKYVLAILLLTGTPHLGSTVFSPANYWGGASAVTGIADERGYYYRHLGLRPVLTAGSWQSHPWLIEGQQLSSYTSLFVRCAAGMAPFAAGSTNTWIDPFALTDPFLARLPARTTSRVGHFERAFPEGYLESRSLGENWLRDPQLSALYDDVITVVSGPLFSRSRFTAILSLNFGQNIDWKAIDFERNAVGLPGQSDRVDKHLSCLGLERGASLTFRLNDDGSVADVFVRPNFPIAKEDLLRLAGFNIIELPSP